MVENKSEFYRLYGAHERFESMLVFAWFHWRKEQGLPWQPKGEYKVEFDYKTKEIVATSNFGEDRFPMKEAINGKDNDPVIEMLWYDNYYDGPLSGMALYKGQHVYFKIGDHSYDNLFNVWTYKLYKLTSEQVKFEFYWHNRFLNEVKDHDHESESFKQYYKDRRKRKDPDYTKNECLGEFDECLFVRRYKR